MNPQELDEYIQKNIQGMFGTADIQTMKEEIEKLNPGDVYLEIGVDEGRSMMVAHYYAKPGVYIFGVDIADIQNTPPVTMGRANFALQEGVVGFEQYGFFIHGDADRLAEVWRTPISLLFIDGGHAYEEVKKNTLAWEPHMKKGGTILYHDIDYMLPGVKGWLDDHYDSWEDLHGKIGKVIM